MWFALIVLRRAKYSLTWKRASISVQQPGRIIGFLLHLGTIFGSVELQTPLCMITLRTLFFAFALNLAFGLSAQVNDKGTFHLSIGLAGGVHGTAYQQTIYVLGIPFVDRQTDGAVSVTVPIRASFGLAKWFSLGLLVEPGSYLDSNATRSNALATIALEPRFYLVNADRFAWFASVQFGATSLQIDDRSPVLQRAEFGGGSFGLGTGIGLYFTDHFGLNLGVRYLASSLDHRKYSYDSSVFNLSNVEGRMDTRGVLLDACLAFKF